MKAKTGAYIFAQALAVVVVLALVSLPLASQTRQGSSSSSCSSTSTAVESMPPVSSEAQLISMVNASFSEHLLHFISGNTFAVTNDFVGDGARMVWNGNAQGLGGNYTGLRAINEVYETFLEPTTSLSMVNGSWTLAPTGSESAEVHSALKFEGHSNLWGNFEVQVTGTDYYAAASGWQITQEFWNFTHFDVQFSLADAGPPTYPSCYE